MDFSHVAQFNSYPSFHRLDETCVSTGGQKEEREVVGRGSSLSIFHPQKFSSPSSFKVSPDHCKEEEEEKGIERSALFLSNIPNQPKSH